jgi:hypothetical protein
MQKFWNKGVRRVPRPKLWLAALSVTALAVAGVAIAGPGGSGSVSAVSATFTATTVTDKTVQTCVGADGNYEITHATYSGIATSADLNLNGPVTLDVNSVVNTTKNLGWLKAHVRFNPTTPGDKAHGKLIAVNSGNQLQGILTGDEGHGSHLLVNTSSGFTRDGGFTAGNLGTGTGINTGIVYSGHCNPPKPPHADEHHGPTGPTGPTGPHGPKHPKHHG